MTTTTYFLTTVACILLVVHFSLVTYSLFNLWSTSVLVVPGIGKLVLMEGTFWSNVKDFQKSDAGALSILLVLTGVGQPLLKSLLYPLFLLPAQTRKSFFPYMTDVPMRKLLSHEEFHSKHVIAAACVGIVMLSAVTL